MKKLLAVVSILMSVSSFAGIGMAKRVDLVTPSSYSCEESESSSASISVYIGAYSMDASGGRYFYSSNTSATYNLSAALCKRMKITVSAQSSNLSTEERTIAIYVNEDEEVISFEDPSNEDLLIFEI